MSNEEISLFDGLPLKNELSLLSVEILNRKAISKEVTHNSYANGFLHTGQKYCCQSHLTISVLHPGLKSDTCFNTVFKTQI